MNKPRKLKMGMIGGGPGAFIGAIHRKAAIMDGLAELVCGAFSSDPNKSKEMGDLLMLDPARVYISYVDMVSKEAALPADQRMDFVSIVTPNHLHAEPAILALGNGFDVIMDKPLCRDLAEARTLQAAYLQSKKTFCLTHTYTGYPLIKEAKQLIENGKLGTIRKVHVEYPQGWLSENIEVTGNKQASWRTDPQQSGKAGALGDIGTHAFNLAEYVSGKKITAVSATLKSYVENRKVDDDVMALLQFENGATGSLLATQIANGEKNNLRIRIYGDKASLDWSHDEPNKLYLRRNDQPLGIIEAGEDYLGALAKHNTRLPSGHPEGYIEAFANIYRNFILCLQAQRLGLSPKQEWKDFPGMEEGMRGMMFIEAMMANAAGNDKWTAIPLTTQ